MRGHQPALAPGWAGIAEEPAALIAHGGVCEEGGRNRRFRLPLLGQVSTPAQRNTGRASTMLAATEQVCVALADQGMSGWPWIETGHAPAGTRPREQR